MCLTFLKNIYLAVPDLSCSTQDLPSSLWHLGSSFVTRDEPRSPALEAQSLSYWTYQSISHVTGR